MNGSTPLAQWSSSEKKNLPDHYAASATKYVQAHIPNRLFCNVNAKFLLFMLQLPQWK